MTELNSGKYKDILKKEFKEALSRFAYSNRKSFHSYVIHRFTYNCLLVDFDFYYLPSVSSSEVRILVDLKEYGELEFVIDTDTSYASIATENYISIIEDIIESYSTYTEEPPTQ